VIDGNVAGGHIWELSQEPQRGNATNGFCTPAIDLELLIFAADFHDGSKFLGVAGHTTGAKHDAKPLRINLSGSKPCVLDRKGGRRDTKLNVAAHDFEEFAIAKIADGIEVTNFSTKRRRKPFGWN
jgi:hypothetical protein